MRVFLKSFLQSFKVDAQLKNLPHIQRAKIWRSVILINLLLAVIVIFFSLRIQHMVQLQDSAIMRQIEPTDKKQIKDYQAKYHKPIQAQMFLYTRQLIDVKSEVMPIEFGLSTIYQESWAVDKEQIPVLDLQKGGFITSHEVSYRKIENGQVEEIGYFEGNIQTNYSALLYPLDKQLLLIGIGTLQQNESSTDRPYLSVSNFEDRSYIYKNLNYKPIKIGIVNAVNHISVPIGETTRGFNDMANNAYILYNHKNIRSYLKVTQYIIFSILIAVFALLINPKKGSAISGRISVVGSSVFSLSANIFQVNTMIRPGSGITLIDLMTAFAGIIILVCFLVTTQTVRLNDRFGYNASKLYDMIMFKCLIFYPIVFFVVTYLQAT